MRTGLLWAFGAWLFAAAPILAQAPMPAVPPDAEVPAQWSPPGPPAAEEAPAHPDAPAPAPEPLPFWLRAEYLAYWVKNAPLPVSLVTGVPANPTEELLNTDQKFGMFSGFRVGGGAWFDSCNTCGWDGNFFWLQQRTSTFATSSGSAGNPTLAFPFTNQAPGAVGDTLMPIASPGVFAGSVQVASTLQLWGAETNGVFSLGHIGDCQFAALGGFRYVDLRETLNIGTVSSDILTVPSTVLSQNDLFNTRNQFYGGQVGGRVNWRCEHFGLDLTGKVAVGETHQSLDVQGTSTQTGPGGVNGTFPGGFFAQNSNSGHFSANKFAILPSVEAKFSVFITSHFRAFVGYDFLYWSQVVRPGNQIDRNINLTQSAVLGAGALMGPAYPMPLLNRSDFWAQGLNAGLEFRF